MNVWAALGLAVLVGCGGGEATAADPAAPTSPAAQTLSNVAYASTSAAQKMDIYMPAGAGPFPAVVLIHGGAFKAGDKAMDAANAATLVANGYVAVAINYRLSGEAKFPAAVHDAKAAVRYIRAKASEYRINPDKIGVWGASAGGHLSAMLGTTGGDTYLEGTEGAYLGVSSRVQASVDWFGPINFATMVSEGLALGFASSYNVDNESAYLGVNANDPTNNELVQQSNPSRYIDAQDPPFWIQVGGADPLIPYTQSLNFYTALKAVLGDAKVSYEKLEGAGHGGAPFSTTANLDKVVAFLNSHLK
ncbi:MAG: alpha/beta hydrolase [Ideonella sp. MAG2]|nr:MAG: alpha/beta hydrolase [Ideonella sp. MAG2]